MNANDDSTIESGPASPARPSSLDALPERIGRYRVLGLIGEGGFGVVYEAEQTEPVKRRVALKVIKLGMDTKQVIARFEAERQALALMDHPHIAKVLDAGATDAGRPFFVMEIVRGDAITDYCDKQNLTIQERLRLFQKVCSAVQHAHQKGVIHRDIKPSNVLITMHDGEPAPKVIDFGIAKATSARLTEKTVFTQQQQLIGTPEYMSPEQAEMSGIDIDTRSDVYSLGVLLYELLTSATPFDAKSLRSAGYGEIQRIIREEAPPKPSTRLSSLGIADQVARKRKTEARRLGAQLRGDLDWIVMKALEKDRTRRYETANGFAADIDRYLNSEPTVASPPSAGYRMRKFVGRNRAGVIAASLVAAALVAGLVGTMWAMTRAVAAAEAEAVARQEAEQLADFQASMLEQVDPTTAGVRLTKEVNRRYAEALEDAGADEAEITRRTEAFRTQWRQVNATDVALALIDETILSPAVEAIDREFADQPLVDARLRQVMASRYATLGLYDVALPLQEQVLEIRRREVGEEDADTIRSEIYQLQLLQEMGRYDDLVELARSTLETAQSILGKEHPVTLHAATNLGLALQRQGSYAESELYFREVIDSGPRILGKDHRVWVDAVNNMGYLLYDLGRVAEAEVYLRKALESDRRVRGDDHLQTMIGVNNLGGMFLGQGKLAEAEVYLREALEGYQRVLGEDHPFTPIPMNNMGRLMHARGLLEEAEAYSREAVELSRRANGETHPYTLIFIGTYGRILSDLRRQEEAIALLAPVESATRESFKGANAYRLAHLLMVLGRSRAALGYDADRFSLAESNLREAYALFMETGGDEHEQTGECAEALVALYTAWNAAEPDAGYDAKLGEWRARLEESDDSSEGSGAATQ